MSFIAVIGKTVSSLSGGYFTSISPYTGTSTETEYTDTTYQAPVMYGPHSPVLRRAFTPYMPHYSKDFYTGDYNNNSYPDIQQTPPPMPYMIQKFQSTPKYDTPSTSLIPSTSLVSFKELQTKYETLQSEHEDLKLRYQMASQQFGSNSGKCSNFSTKYFFPSLTKCLKL